MILPSLVAIGTVVVEIYWFSLVTWPCKAGNAQKMKSLNKDFFSKCDQICRVLRIWSHLLKKSLIKTLVFVQWQEQSVNGLYGLNPVKISHQHTTFSDQRHCGSRDMMVLVCYVCSVAFVLISIHKKGLV